VCSLLVQPEISVNQTDETGQSPLIMVAKYIPENQEDKDIFYFIAQMLLDFNGIMIDAVDHTGTTALMYASLVGNISLVQALIDSGSSVNLTQNETGNTSLHFAVMNDYTEVANILLKKGALSIPNIDGQVPLDKATSNPMKELLKGKYTSVTHPFQVNFINSTDLPVLQNGSIGMCMCPGRNNHKKWSRDFATDLKVLISNNVELVVNLMTSEEIKKMGLSDVSERLQSVGIEWLHYPISDKWIPGSNDDFLNLTQILVEKIKLGKRIVVHCNGGKGRTGLTVVACLIKLGVTQLEAITKIRNVRPGMLQNPAQQMYLSMLEKKLHKDQKLSKKTRAWKSFNSEALTRFW
jgi:protein-tyrosine phosphatase